VSPKIDNPIDALVIGLRKNIDLSISSLLDISSSPSHEDVTYGVMPHLPISFPQPDEFKEGEKSKGDVSTHVDKWHKDLPDVDKQGEFIELEDIFLAESIVVPTVKVNSLI